MLYLALIVLRAKVVAGKVARGKGGEVARMRAEREVGLQVGKGGARGERATLLLVLVMFAYRSKSYPPHRLFAYAYSPTQLNGTPSLTEHEPHHTILKPYISI